MQTFLPYPNFRDSAQTLDRRRLGKQRVECVQIVKALISDNPSRGWRNHPAVKMWEGYIPALKEYTNCILEEWEDRGYRNNIKYYSVDSHLILDFPPWLGDRAFHTSHKVNLYRKDPVHYSVFRHALEEYTLEGYLWPKFIDPKKMSYTLVNK